MATQPVNRRYSKYRNSRLYVEKQLEIQSRVNKVILDEHIISIEELVTRLDTDLDTGLSSDQVYERNKRDGDNLITPQPKTPQIVSFMRNLFGGFGILLLTGSALCFVAYFMNYWKNNDHSKQSLWLGVALIIVDVFSAFFSFYQEEKCKVIINSFKKIVPNKATVVRDNVIMVVKVENIVIGDIVQLRAGDKVPADIRIFESNLLKLDNSSLTGECDPMTRSSTFTNIDPLQTQNLAFLSTLVVEGNCQGIVIKTGDRTLMGQIAYLVSEVEYYESILSREINDFIQSISIAALIIGFMFFFISIFYGYFWLDSVIFLISILVAKVPEGLLATITVALTLIAKRISKKNCLVKNLEAVETLGATTVICSDKTGTLTQNKMITSHLWINNEIITAESFEKGFVLATPPNIFEHNELLRSFTLTTNATFDTADMNLPIHIRNCKGDPSEIAILKFVEYLSCDVSKYRKENPRFFEAPFNSFTKYQLSVHKTQIYDKNKDFLVVMKGAPEIIMSYCSEILIKREIIPLTKAWQRKIDECCKILGNKGERIFGFCELRLDNNEYPDNFNFKLIKPNDKSENENEVPNFQLKNMRFLGLISLLDPPRPGVGNAVQKCISAGIRVIMITGDHPMTAKAIAKAVGIITNETVDEVSDRIGYDPTLINNNDIKAAVIDGDVLKKLTNDQLDDLLSKYPEIVFARTTPHQKLNIVESCQRLGGIVAVTGDGVNDSPALKKADIGIAMGIAGSEVSKEAADILLLDDNFATIMIAIEEGRLIFDNLKKSITYILASKMPELIPFIMYVCYLIPLPLGAITILCIDLGTDLLPAISLAYEKPEGDIMKRKPRDCEKDRLVNMTLISLSYGQYGMIAASAGFFTYAMIMAENGFFPSLLIGISRSWDSEAVNDLSDSYGQDWTFEQRKALEYTCHSGFFISVVVVQIATLIVCKTRKASLFQQGMSNVSLNFSLTIEICLAVFLCYTPVVNAALQTYPLRWTWWIPSVFFSILLFVYDEARKFLVRKFPGGWIERETYT